MAHHRSIAIIKQGGLGDHILTLPFAKALRGVEPGASITLFSSPAQSEFWDANPDVDRVIPIRPNTFRNHAHNLADLFLGRRKVKEKFDLVFNPTHCLDIYRNGLVVNNLHSKEKIGFRQDISPFDGYDANIYYTNLLDRPRYDHVIKYSEYMFHSVYPGSPFDYGIKLPCQQKSNEWVEQYLSKFHGIPIVGIHPAGTVNYRTLSARQLVEIIHHTIDLGYAPVILGENVFGLSQPNIIFTGRLELSKLFCLISKMKAVICVDSSIKHIAGAFHIPILELAHIPRHLLHLNGPFIDGQTFFSALSYWDPLPDGPLHEVVFPLWGQSIEDIHSGRSLHSIGLREVAARLEYLLERRFRPYK
ncbi:glycosyltransferase family 9 protein [Polynucleobacter paneuropaeus]|uniref:glycosyltransferase family 9 protein n=1 Tax=Polynucleobacter paneuropaeus TaxID=2527775 RepID=UPI001BFE7525|nr:glycosyltransferase family 9 protein [Polynucleobacter paneuropaeus]QWD49713.1 glycosyltransferase family 9 protein [Polynucleobacter paneuropaeus]